MAHKRPVFAAVDLGSNSFHLVIARLYDGGWHFLDRIKIPVRLAAGLRADHTLDEQAQQRALEAMRLFEERLRDFHPDHVRVVGTNTFRAAKQTDRFLQQAQGALGFPIDIINGREEARLIYMGVVGEDPVDLRRKLVIDIGGGSTELIIGEGLRPFLMESLHMGCVTYSEHYFGQHPVTENRLKQAFLAARSELDPIANAYKAKGWSLAVGASGTTKALAFLSETLTGSDTITVSSLGAIQGLMSDPAQWHSARWPLIKPDRFKALPGGVAIMSALFDALGIESLTFTSGALREGLLYEMRGEVEHRDLRDVTVQQWIQRFDVDRLQAQRIEQCCLNLWPQLCKPGSEAYTYGAQILSWASQLHEIGLSISHASYHKHGAYLLFHADLAGFLRREKALLSFLVGNHRRRIRCDGPCAEVPPRWDLLLLLRLACIFFRSRKERTLPFIKVKLKENRIKVLLPQGYLDSNPLTALQLNEEVGHWQEVGFRFKVAGWR
jgi:exopolyphosphatase/guanosine-5'-triphosphate,3'-diphosphate pyrophosphatase